MNRRIFLQMIGRAGALTLIGGFAGGLSACQSIWRGRETRRRPFLPFQPLRAKFTHELEWARGFNPRLLIDAARIQRAPGVDPVAVYDTVVFQSEENRALLWLNHGGTGGGSFVPIARADSTSPWRWARNDSMNRIIKPTFVGNRAAAATPWQTVIVGEENFVKYYGDTLITPEGGTVNLPPTSRSRWRARQPGSPQDHGWVVEINPRTGEQVKHFGLGRFAHGGLAVTTGLNGRAVIYMSDSAMDQCLYKFISHAEDSLAQGTLYVADFTRGEWVPLDLELRPELKNRFRTQTEVLIYARQAAQILGGTPLRQPRDLEIDPTTKAVIVAQLNGKNHGDYHGSLLRIEEQDSDPLATNFTYNTFLTGGLRNGFSCPDRLAFDGFGNLWMTTHMGEFAGRPPYEPFGSDSLFFIPFGGREAGGVFRVANAPAGAPFTGLSFDRAQRTLFLSHGACLFFLSTLRQS